MPATRPRGHLFARPVRLQVPLALCGVFCVSRALFYAVGVRYDDSSLGWFWQYLDTDVLRSKLLEGCFFLHSQPPGFNLFLGAILKLAPSAPCESFHVAFLACGMVILLSMYGALKLSGFSTFVAALVSTAFILSPGAILYENWLFYTYPTTALLALATVALLRYGVSKDRLSALLFLSSVTLVCFIHSMFHLAYLLVCVLLLCWQEPGKRWRILLASAPFVLLLCALYAKNLILFGNFGPSSWMGMNLWKIASLSTDPEEVRRMVAEHKLPEVARQPPFLPLRMYPEPYREVPLCYANIDALSRPDKGGTMPVLKAVRPPGGSGGEQVLPDEAYERTVANYNHFGYIAASKDYLRASLRVIRTHRRGYLSAVLDAWLLYLRPSYENVFLEENRQAISGYVKWTSFWREGCSVSMKRVRRMLFGVRRSCQCPLSSLVLFPSILAGAVVLSAASLWKRRTARPPETAALLFMTLTVLYVALLGNAVEYGENNRFRVVTDPLYCLLFLLCVKRIVLFLSGRRRPTNSAPPPDSQTTHPVGKS